MASGGSVGSIRFNDSTPRTITIASGTLSAGAVLMTPAAGNSTITGGSLKAINPGAELVLVEGSPSNVLTISSNIVDNSTSGVTAAGAAGAGRTILSGQNSYNGKTLIGPGTLQFANLQSLYNSTPASWTASNIVVSNRRNAGFECRRSRRIYRRQCRHPAALGTATGGLTSGASIGLDTTNAAGGVFTLTSPIVNTNGGANVIGLTKNGVGTLQLAAGANSYTGPTAINQGTLKLTATNSLTGNTAVSLGNDPTATFDVNGLIRRSAACPAAVRPEAPSRWARETSPSTQRPAPPTAVRSPAPEQSTSIWAFRHQHHHANAYRAGLYSGAVTVANGTVVLAPTSPTTWGSSTLTLYVGSLNSSSATLTVGANATLAADNLMLAGNLYTSTDTTTGGTAVLNVNAATSKVTANTLNFGFSNLPFDSVSQNPPPGVLPLTFNAPTTNATATLSNGTIELAGTTLANGYTFIPTYGAAAGATPAPATLIDGPVNVAMIMAPDNNETAIMNISGTEI